MASEARSLFVTGTDTDVGKSIVSALLTLGLGASYWKPIQSGPGPAALAGDRAYIQSLTGLGAEHFLPERHRLSQPLSPHAAAAIDGVTGELFQTKLTPAHDHIRGWLQELPGPVAVTYGPWRPGDQRVFVADIRKAEALLGWRPEVTPAEGIGRLYEWVANNPALF